MAQPDRDLRRIFDMTGGLATPVTVRLADLESGAWPPPAMADRVLVLPFTAPGSIHPDGVLITGIADPRWAQGDHRALVELIANLLGCAVAAARARTAERERVTAPTALRELADASHALATSLNALIPGAQPCFIDTGTGIPLGGASRLVEHGPAFTARTIPMPPGSALGLYTDGLVEIKNRELDNGLDQLRDALRGTIGSAEDLRPRPDRHADRRRHPGRHHNACIATDLTTGG